MIKHLVCLATLLTPLQLRAGELPDNVGMAARVCGYAAARQAAARFFTQILPDYSQDTPDSWLISTAKCGGMESVDERGDFVLLGLDTAPPGWAMVLPVRSAGLYLDSLRSALGDDHAADGFYTFIDKQEFPDLPGLPPVERKLCVRVIDQKAILAASPETCKAAAALLDKKEPAWLLEKGPEGRLQGSIKGSFIARNRAQLFETIFRIQLFATTSLDSPEGIPLASFYTETMLDLIENPARIDFEAAFTSRSMDLTLTLVPKPDSVLAKFMQKQKAPERNLLDVIPGQPIVTAAGRIEGLELLEAPYAASLTRLCKLVPQRAPNADTAVSWGKERLRRFGAAFGGHFASALVQPPGDSFGVDYLRAYEVKDPARALDAVNWELGTLRKHNAAVENLPEQNGIRSCKIQHTQRPQPDLLCWTVVNNLLLVASGANAQANIAKMAQAAATPSEQAASKSKLYARATANAPEGAAVTGMFSISGFLHWVGSSGRQGMETLAATEPATGLAAWFSPRPDGSLEVRLRVRASELLDFRKALFGEAPLMALPVQ